MAPNVTNNDNDNNQPSNSINQKDEEITLAAAYQTLFDDASISDVQLQRADGVGVNACRVILAARSPVIRSMLFGSFAEANHNNTGTKDGADFGVAAVPIGYSSKTLSSIVQYCCTDNVELINSTACNAALTVDIVSLADAANYFALPVLKQRAEDLACK